MSYGSYSEGVIPCNHVSIGTRKPPFSSPAAVILSSSNGAQKSTARSGTNSPYVKGGVLVIPVKVAVPYKTIVGSYMAPVRRREYYWDQKAGRKRFRWIIQYQRRNVWGTKVRFKTIYTRVRQEDPGLLLRPNNLNYDATIQAVGSASAQHVANPGLPSELRTVTTQNGRIVGGVSGAATQFFLGTPGIPWPSLTQKLAELDRKALAGLYSRVNEEGPNLALIAAESGKTMTMLYSIFTAGVSLMRSLKRLDLDGARRVIVGNSNQDLANRWLAFQYGVKPLISDAADIMDELGRSAKAWRKYTSPRSDSVKTTTTASAAAASKSTFEFTIDMTVKYSVLLDTNVSIGSSLNRYGFGNAPGLVWELIPFSFVIDWFLPIGNYLNSCQCFQSNVRYFWRTTTVLYDVSYSTTHGSQPGGGLIGGGYGPEGSETRLTCQRSVLGSVPALPLPTINRQPFNITRVLSALSLYLQRR